MSYFVLDTHVMVSGFLSSDSAAGMILNELVNMSIALILDSRIYLEYRDVLERPRFRLSPSLVEPVLALVKAKGMWISPQRYNGPLISEGDRPFVEAALSAGVPVISRSEIVTSAAGPLTVLSPEMFLCCEA